MPYGDPDFEDPQELVGVALPGDEETTRAMARAFAEEFVQLGFCAERLLAVFRDPRYAGAHRAYRALGAEAIEAIVAGAERRWGGFRVRTTDAAEEDALGRRRLRVTGPAGR